MQYFRRLIILIFLLLTCAYSFAQNHSCTGTVVEKTTNMPVQYATIRLLKLSDSSLYAGAITNEKGDFIIKGISENNYICRISYVGYLSVDIPVTIVKNIPNINLGNIKLMPTNEVLQEVTITGQAPVNVKIDRTIYKVDSSMMSGIVTTQDLLKKIPDLHINQTTGLVNVKGKESTKIMINGVLSPEEVMLKSIAPENIEKIEVITSPSSEYETGIDAVVNIVLKEKVSIGCTSSLFADWYLPPFNKVQIMPVFQYGTEKIRYNFTYSYLYRANHKLSDTTYRESFDDNKNQHIYQCLTNPQKHTRQTHLIDNRLDFYINKNNFLHFFSRNTISPINVMDTSFSTHHVNNELTDMISALSKQKANTTIGNYTLFYRKNFARENHQLTGNFNFHHTNYSNNVMYNEIEIENILNPVFYERNEQEKSTRYSYNLKIDYNNSVSEKFTFNTGALGYYQTFHNDYQDGGFSDTVYNYSNLKMHYYIDFLLNFKKFSFRMGNKVESYFTYIDNMTGINQTSYLPSMTATQKLGKFHTLSLNFYAQNYYPSVWDLSPYTSYSADSSTIWHGNPNLKPNTQYGGTLSYWFRKKMMTLQIDAASGYMHNAVVTNSYKNEQNILITEPVNISGQTVYVIKFIPSFDFDIVSFGTQFKLSYTYFNNKDDHRKNLGYYGEIYTYWYLPKDFEIDIEAYHSSKSLTFQGYTTYSPSIDIYILKRLLNGNAQISLGYTGLFFKAETINVTDKNNIYQWQKSDYNRRGFNLTFSYFFRKGKVHKMEYMEKYQDNDLKKTEQ